jgi:MFS family permease
MQVQTPEPIVAPPVAPFPDGWLRSSGGRRALAGFYVSGVLLGFLGAILLSWEHHLSSSYDIVALYFLGLAGGLLASVRMSQRLLQWKGIAWSLSFACGLAGTAFLCLAFASPPMSPWWRVAALALVGLSAGILHTAVFHAISPVYRQNPVGTVNLAGMLFGFGCFTDAVLISLAYYIYSVPVIQVWIAIIPALFGWVFWKGTFSDEPVPTQPRPAALFAGLKNPGAVLLSLLLFFQLGNEWAVAGWLPLFLSQRLGIAPTSSLWMLAIYWLALSAGRIAAQWILPRVRHSRLLIGSVVAVIFGSGILSLTNNQFGAVVGILMLGGAFAPIYPLVIEKIGYSFPSYQPGFYNGLFSFAMAGGLIAPASLGYIAMIWGVGTVMMLPMFGSTIVFLLLVLIWLEARLSAHVRPA